MGPCGAEHKLQEGSISSCELSAGAGRGSNVAERNVVFIDRVRFIHYPGTLLTATRKERWVQAWTLEAGKAKRGDSVVQG